MASLLKDSYRCGRTTPTLIFENLKPVEISILTSFEHLKMLYRFSKLGGCGSKIKHATPILFLK